VAIRASDEQAYAASLAKHPDSPRDAFYAWKADEQNQTIEQVIDADRSLSTTRNPFNARTDPAAVSRGAVIYENHCMSCHGEDSDGNGPVAATDTDFHSFIKRFAITLHFRDVTKKWFQTINDGSSRRDDSDVYMPSFENVLAREQIWLMITYLQSLDMDADVSARADMEAQP